MRERDTDGRTDPWTDTQIVRDTEIEEKERKRERERELNTCTAYDIRS